MKIFVAFSSSLLDFVLDLSLSFDAIIRTAIVLFIIVLRFDGWCTSYRVSNLILLLFRSYRVMMACVFRVLIWSVSRDMQLLGILCTTSCCCCYLRVRSVILILTSCALIFWKVLTLLALSWLLLLLTLLLLYNSLILINDILVASNRFGWLSIRRWGLPLRLTAHLKSLIINLRGDFIIWFNIGLLSLRYLLLLLSINLISQSTV